MTGTYVMPSFGRYEPAAELVRRLRAREAAQEEGVARSGRRRCGVAVRVRPVHRGRGMAPAPRLACPRSGRSDRPDPPYPDAVTGQRVYDYAGIFSPAGDRVGRSDDQGNRGPDRRPGCRVHPGQAGERHPRPADDDALALLNQWGVGRKGFDDGLVILFDMQGNLVHGQVPLYAGYGFKASFMTNADRQAVFDNDMKPLLTGWPP